jgi:hypothetical protein
MRTAMTGTSPVTVTSRIGFCLLVTFTVWAGAAEAQDPPQGSQASDSTPDSGSGAENRPGRHPELVRVMSHRADSDEIKPTSGPGTDLLEDLDRALEREMEQPGDLIRATTATKQQVDEAPPPEGIEVLTYLGAGSARFVNMDGAEAGDSSMLPEACYTLSLERATVSRQWSQTFEGRGIEPRLELYIDQPSPPVMRDAASSVAEFTLAVQVPPLRADGPIVAVLDTGIDFEHTILEGRTADGYGKCFTSNFPPLGASCLCRGDATCSSWPDEPVDGKACESSTNWCDHGTHTAGSIALLDVEPRIGIRILSIQVNSRFANPGFCHDPGSCVLSFESDRIRALHWIATESESALGQKVAAVHLGQSAGAYQTADECSDAHRCMEIAVENLWAQGIPVIAPAGNGYRREAIGAPACLGKVISVAAAGPGDGIAFFTNAAPERPDWKDGEPRLLDFFAPGIEVETAIPDDSNVRRASISGTSMAAAHLAAAWVRLAELCPRASPDVILGTLRSLSRRKVTDTRRDGQAEDVPLIDVTKIDWSAARRHCELMPCY